MKFDTITEFEELALDAKVKATMTGEGETAGLTISVLMLVDRLDRLAFKIDSIEKILRSRM